PAQALAGRALALLLPGAGRAAQDGALAAHRVHLVAAAQDAGEAGAGDRRLRLPLAVAAPAQHHPALPDRVDLRGAAATDGVQVLRGHPVGLDGPPATAPAQDEAGGAHRVHLLRRAGLHAPDAAQVAHAHAARL